MKKKGRDTYQLTHREDSGCIWKVGDGFDGEKGGNRGQEQLCEMVLRKEKHPSVRPLIWTYRDGDISNHRLSM